ncbi:hypothetical protein Fmac_009590 [Flemingia macrophylla]|uniref:Transmembrane protein n=1 Tax=Flemingia macrophylla TaxID=520843 RepID=A0ABD1N0P4_9FABA
MDHRSANDRDTEVDLESGLPLIGDDSKRVSIPSSAKQGKALFAKVSEGFVRGSVKGDEGPILCCNESSSREVSTDLMEVTSKPMMGKDSSNCGQQTPGKEKRKKTCKMAPKPPRPPQAPALDAADRKLIKELSELAMLKRARIERMKALKKMKIAKASSPSSNSSSILAMIFTVVFFVVIIFQGMSSGKSPVGGFQGSPLSTGGSDGGLISVEYQLNPSASDTNAPDSESHK